jgi:hypothetical protein
MVRTVYCYAIKFAGPSFQSTRSQIEFAFLVGRMSRAQDGAVLLIDGDPTTRANVRRVVGVKPGQTLADSIFAIYNYYAKWDVSTGSEWPDRDDSGRLLAAEAGEASENGRLFFTDDLLPSVNKQWAVQYNSGGLVGVAEVDALHQDKPDGPLRANF